MAEKKNTQAHNATPSNPFAAAMQEQTSRLDAALADLTRVEAENMERALTAVDEMARLTKESLTYAANLSAEWRKLTLDATRRTSEIFRAGA